MHVGGNMKRAFLAGVVLLATSPLWAEVDKDKATAKSDEEKTVEGVNWEPGPKKISLGNNLDLNLDKDYVYLNPKDAKRLLEKMGNMEDDSLLGMVVPKDEGSGWWVHMRYVDEGYVKDDEKIDGDAILKMIREGTEESNQYRKEKGFPALVVDGWSEPPHYDKATHRLMWAVAAHSTRGKSVNYNTRVLGRKGYVSLNLITSPDTLEKDKVHVQKLLQDTQFLAGFRYEDFNPKSDKIAKYGIAALIAGGAGVAALKVAKIGLLAKFGKLLIGLLIAGKKAIVLALAAVGVYFRGLFKKKSDTPAVAASSPPPDETPPENPPV